MNDVSSKKILVLEVGKLYVFTMSQVPKNPIEQGYQYTSIGKIYTPEIYLRKDKYDIYSPDSKVDESGYPIVHQNVKLEFDVPFTLLENNKEYSLFDKTGYDIQILQTSFDGTNMGWIKYFNSCVKSQGPVKHPNMTINVFTINPKNIPSP